MKEFFLKYFYLLINLFLAALGLCGGACFSLVAESEGSSLAAVPRLLTVVRSMGSRVCGLQQLQHMGSIVVASGL